jgi:hypothetical protein
MMRPSMVKRRIRIIDLVHNAPSGALYRRVMFPNYVSIMPQILAAWCRQAGHEVDYDIFTGPQRLSTLLSGDPDVVFISSFTYTAQLAYALGNYFRSRGSITVLGGPHARSFQEDACRHFDYVLGLTDKTLVMEVLESLEPRRGEGAYRSAASQPASLPSLRDRWEFVEVVHRQSTFVKAVSLLGSTGCPYTCDFCVDAGIPYHTLDADAITDDLQFILTKQKSPIVSWLDPNFGVDMNHLIGAIEKAVPPGRIRFAAQCSLSVLNEKNVERLRRNGFQFVLPGIESFYAYGYKAKTGKTVGIEKVEEVAGHVNKVQARIPQVQTNFVCGLDCDEGDDPFTCMKRFVDMAPGAYPSYTLLTVYGRSANNLSQYDGRMIPFPFHMLRSSYVTNVIPKHYTWEDLYVRYIDLLKHAFSARAMARRFGANHSTMPRWVTLLLSLTIGGWSKIRDLEAVLRRLRSDEEFRSFVEGQTTRIPAFMIADARRDLGPLWEWLPDKSLTYEMPTPEPAAAPVVPPTPRRSAAAV